MGSSAALAQIYRAARGSTTHDGYRSSPRWRIGSTRWRRSVTAEAFEAIARTLPLGQVGYENAVGAKGQRLIWLDRAVVNRLRSLHGVG